MSGNEAVALSVLCQGFALGTGYPGTPSTEILESLARRCSAAPKEVPRVQWATNEKVALEVGLGVAFAGARAIVTMKHVGVNVAADVLFSSAYASIPGALVIVSADDPGMASSQNEQDNRRYAIAAGIPMLEPCDSQQAFDYLAIAVQIAERWLMPVLIRMTTRVCHSKSVVTYEPQPTIRRATEYKRDVQGRVMLPTYARQAHRQLRRKLAEVAQWAETAEVTQHIRQDDSLGIISSGPAALHAREAAPDASMLILGMAHPLPLAAVTAFVESVKRCIVIEEGDPVLFESARAAGVNVIKAPDDFRFGELNVHRVRNILSRSAVPEPKPASSKPPELCQGCPHRAVFTILVKHGLVIAGDIGCYTLAALPPMSAMDTVVCMGASIGIGIGLRHALAPSLAQRVVSVIGDSTFVHSGITGLVEMVYNAPDSGHVVVVLDNGTTAMTGLQEHPGTGRTLSREPTARLSIEAIARAAGVNYVEVIDPCTEADLFERTLLRRLERHELAVIIARHPCILAAARDHAERGSNGAAARGTQ